MRADADLSMRAQARLVAEFLERMDLREATLVGNYWGAVAGFRGDRRAGGKAGARLVRGIRELSSRRPWARGG